MGSSVDQQRQKGPHAHSINLDPANRFAFAADLGLDKVLVYKFDPAQGTLTANDPAGADVAQYSPPQSPPTVAYTWRISICAPAAWLPKKLATLLPEDTCGAKPMWPPSLSRIAS